MKKILLSFMILLLMFGCSSPKNDDKKEEEVIKDPVITYGVTFEFDGFQFTFLEDIAWTTIDNKYSDYNGKIVALIPVKVSNQSGDTGSVNMFYWNVYDAAGLEADELSSSFLMDGPKTLMFDSEMRDGAETVLYVCVLYTGDGDYYIEFKNFEEKVEVKLPITYTEGK